MPENLLGKKRLSRWILIFMCLLSSQPILAQEKEQFFNDLPVVKSAALAPNINVPWSQPVKVSDPFEGEFIAIFDRNYFNKYVINTYAEIDVVSLWMSDSIRFLLVYSERDCLQGGLYTDSLGNNCSLQNGTQTVVKLYIKLGEQVFELEGENSIFEVNDELAAALRNSPPENVSIRLISASGVSIDSEIGKGTVEAWKAIY